MEVLRGVSHDRMRRKLDGEVLIQKFGSKDEERAKKEGGEGFFLVFEWTGHMAQTATQHTRRGGVKRSKLVLKSR